MHQELHTSNPLDVAVVERETAGRRVQVSHLFPLPRFARWAGVCRSLSRHKGERAVSASMGSRCRAPPTQLKGDGNAGSVQRGDFLVVS